MVITFSLLPSPMTSNRPKDPAIRVAMMPSDTNVHGTIFGGVILSHIDQAGAIAARAYTRERVVTVAIKEVEFHKPVYVGDIVSYYAWVTALGTTSITVKVEVMAERYRPYGRKVEVTAAELVYVSVDDHFEKIPVSKEPITA
ncbi:MAG TPA: acyl-CoA thioesterase [Planctomycetota bacterium]|jgi:acyl-CoA thioesterase YciA|nr:acyl-CoA thioesterase [Planctomycetota bacterium]